MLKKKKEKKNKLYQNKKGSVLIFSLIVMSLVLIMGLNVMSLEIYNRRSSLDSAKSFKTFQIADSAAEIILKKIYIEGYKNVKDLKNHPESNWDNPACDDSSGVAIVSGKVMSNDKNFKSYFFDEDGDKIESCENSEKIAFIRSIGYYFGLSRAIELAVE